MISYNIERDFKICLLELRSHKDGLDLTSSQTQSSWGEAFGGTQGALGAMWRFSASAWWLFGKLQQELGVKEWGEEREKKRPPGRINSGSEEMKP